MLDFIFMVFAEVLSTGSKRKIQNDSLFLPWESNQQPLLTTFTVLIALISKSFKDMSSTSAIVEWLEGHADKRGVANSRRRHKLSF